MKRIKLLFFFLLPLFMNAQESEGGMWATFSTKYELNKRIDLGVEGQFRLDDDFSRYDASLLDAGGSYKINKYLKAGATYRFGHSQRDPGYFETRHRIAVDFRADDGFGEWDLDFRVRYQVGISNIKTTEGNADLKDAIRYRLKADRKLISKTDLSLSMELFQNTNLAFAELTDWRFRAEISRKIKKRQSASIGYMTQREMNANNPLMQHILTVGYSVKLKFKKKKDKGSQE
jgi:hypothetical protein